MHLIKEEKVFLQENQLFVCLAMIEVESFDSSNPIASFSAVFFLSVTCHLHSMASVECRDVVRFSNPGGQAVMWWA